MSAAAADRDYNALSEENFRQEVRAFVEAEYPPHLRYILHRARWREMQDWGRECGGYSASENARNSRRNSSSESAL